ncbi:uncharacterized protein V6R79_026020 [Siganus canaliculatus]
MIPSSLPSPPLLRQETTILRVERRRDIHVEGYGSSEEEEEEEEEEEKEEDVEEGGAQAWARDEELEKVGEGLESAKQRIQQRYAAPYEAL